MTSLDTILSWISGQPLLNLGVALAVVVGIALLPLGKTVSPRLEKRARGVVQDANNTLAKHKLDNDWLHRLALQIRFTETWKKLVDWLLEHTSLGRTYQQRFRQAGLRNPRIAVQFGTMRILHGASFGFLAYVGLDFLDLSSMSLAVVVLLIATASVAGLYAPNLYLHNLITKRRRQFELFWDDAIGLLIICLDAGLSIEVAMRRIARELAPTAPVLAEELTITMTDLSLMSERRQAYLSLAQRVDLPSVKTVAIALIQAEKQGASIASSLRVIAASNRQSRIALAEEKAAALGPKMTIPMIVFFLPVIFVIIIAPIALTANF
jgi:tight adherence protein C